MTDEELAAINERWKWISHDLLPDANQAKVDVRALYDEVKRTREALRQEQREHANCEQFNGDVSLAQIQFAGILAQQNEQLREIVRVVANFDDDAYPDGAYCCHWCGAIYDGIMGKPPAHTDACPIPKARAILGQ